MSKKIDINTGLTKQQVQDRRRAGLVNTSVKAPSKTVKQIIIGNTFTYFNFVFIAIAVLLVMVGSFRNLTFLPVIIANTLIGIFQEIRSKITLDRLIMLNAPSTSAMRDGEEKELNTEWLVKDDIAIFRAGDQISADAVVVDGSAAVNESLLTGEADDIQKEVGSELLSGSFIVSGEIKARLTKVGAESYISKLTLEAKKEKRKEQSEIIRSLNRIVTLAGIAIVPIGLILFCQEYFGGAHSAKIAVEASVAAIIGLIPEGLFLLSSVALALSAMRLARQKVLPQDMKSIETLARIDTLCVDKTGTITDARMKIASLELFKNANTISRDELFELISNFGAAQSSDNITMAAVKEYFNHEVTMEAGSVSGFSPEFKYSGVNFASGSYVLGAPEFVLREDYAKYQEEIEDYSRHGYRVLVFGRYDGTVDGLQLKHKVEPLGLILVTNPIRESAPDTFQYFADQGVNIKVISGDNPLTVSEVAKKANIQHADKYIDASTLKTDEDIEKAILKYTVFGRVTPDQKRKFVKALQSHGHTVAMTGDGVNDVLALRDADCSIAMASGSDAAVQIAQIVLLESDFSKMPQVVAEGRQVVNNLERSGSLFIIKNIFSLLTSIFAIIFSITYPLIPTQVSMISMFTIGIPAFLLSQIPNTRLIKGNFVHNILVRAFPGGIMDVIAIFLLLFAGFIFKLDSTDISTSCTLVIAAIGLIMVYRASMPLTPVKWGILAICASGLTLSYLIIPDFFGVDHLSPFGLICCALLAVAAWFGLKYVERFTTACINKVEEYLGKFWRRYGERITRITDSISDLLTSFKLDLKKK